MNESTDDDVLAQRATADVEAFAILYRRYVQHVYSYSLSRIGNPQDAQDLAARILPHAKTPRRYGIITGHLFV